MNPQLALFLWLVLLLALLRFDPAKDLRLSSTLWLPIAWIFIVGSRLPSQWMGGAIGYDAANMAEGNALDRVVYLSLIALSMMILVQRSGTWKKLAVGNLALCILLGFALLSVFWSDYPFIALKRWVRDVGIYLAIGIVVTDPNPAEAIKFVLRRVMYLLIPLSIVMIKYFPQKASEYDWWTGQQYSTGAATSKNMLGVVCLVSALYFIWDILVRWRNSHEGRSRGVRWVNGVFLAMSLWLLAKSSSATSSICFLLGFSILAVAHTRMIRRKPGLLTALIPGGLVIYVILQFGLGIDFVAVVSEAFGRSPDLTGRTQIWQVVLSAGANPYVGAGYESFWLGPRLQWVWERAGTINHAHNGYLEVYLHLGLVGLLLLAAFLIGRYRKIARDFHRDPSYGSLGIALWAVILFYNFTEAAAFKGQFLWVSFLVLAVTSPNAESSDLRPVSFALGPDTPRKRTARMTRSFRSSGSR